MEEDIVVLLDVLWHQSFDVLELLVVILFARL